MEETNNPEERMSIFDELNKRDNPDEYYQHNRPRLVQNAGYYDGDGTDTFDRAYRLLSNIEDVTERDTKRAMLKNSDLFSQIYNISWKQAFDMHDTIASGIMPKSSATSLAQTLGEITTAAWEDLQYQYVAGLVGAGDDSELMRSELARLREATNDRQKLSSLMQQLDESQRSRFEKTLGDLASTAPQLLGQMAERFNMNYQGRSYGYYSGGSALSEFAEGEDISRADVFGEMIRTVSRPLSGGARFTHITNAGNMYLDLWNEIDAQGIELTETQKADVDHEIRKVSNIYAGEVALEGVADVALAGIGGKIIGSASGVGIKGAASAILRMAGAHTVNIGQGFVSEFVQEATTAKGQYMAEFYAGLRDKPELSDKERYELFEQSVAAGAVGGRVSALLGAAGNVGGVVVGGIRTGAAYRRGALTPETKYGILTRQQAQRVTRSSIAAAVMADVDASDYKAVASIVKTRAEAGPVGVEQLRRADRELLTKMQSVEKGSSDSQVYKTYQALMAKTIEDERIARPEGVYSTEKHAYKDLNFKDYPGQLTIDYKTDENGAYLDVAFKGERTKSFEGLRYDIEQGERSGMSITKYGESPFPDDHPLMHQVNMAVDDYKISYMREGIEYDIDNLNISDTAKSMLRYKESIQAYMKGMKLEDINVEEDINDLRSLQMLISEELKTLPEGSIEKAALKQGFYELQTDIVFQGAIQYSYDKIGAYISETLKQTAYSEQSIRGMEDTLMRAGVYMPTDEEVSRYQSLIKKKKDRAKWTPEEIRLARKNELEDIGKLNMSELARVNDIIMMQANNAEHLLDVNHAGHILEPELAIKEIITEIQDYNKNKELPLAEQIQSLERKTLLDKIKSVKTLAYSSDNHIASIAGDSSMLYDLLMVQIRESGMDAQRTMYQQKGFFEDGMVENLNRRGIQVDHNKLASEIQKWKMKKVDIKGVKFTNAELLSIMMHNRSADNKSHLANGIVRKTRDKGEINIPSGIVTEALIHIQRDPFAQAAADSMKPVMENIRGMEEQVLRILRGDPKYKFGLEDYFPIHIASGGYDPFKGDFTIHDDRGGFDRITTNKTMLLDRTSAPDAPIILTDAFQDFQVSIDRGSRFSHQETAFWRASRIMQDPEFKNTVANTLGMETWDSAWSSLQDMAGVRNVWENEHPLISGVMRKMMVARSISALGLNPVSAARAWSSVYGAMSYVDSDVAIEAMTTLKTEDGKGLREFVSEMSAMYNVRVENGMYPEFMNGNIADNAAYKSSKFKNGMFWMMKHVDADAAARSWMAGFLQVQKDIESGKVSDIVTRATGISHRAMMKLPQEKRIQLGIQVGDYVMNISQPSQESYTRSGLQRSGVAGLMLTQFGSSINAMRQQAIYAVEIGKRADLSTEEKARKISAISTSLSLQAATYVGVGLVGSAMYGQFAGDDGEGKLLKKAAADYINTFLSVFGVGRVASLRIKEASKKDQAAGAGQYKIGVGFSFPIPSLSDSDQQRFLNQGAKIMRSWEDPSRYEAKDLNDAYIDVMTILAGTGAMFTPIGGLPTGQIKKGVEALENWSDNE